MIVSPTPRPESVRKKNVFISIVWLGSRCCFYYNFEQRGEVFKKFCVAKFFQKTIDSVGFSIIFSNIVRKLVNLCENIIAIRNTAHNCRMTHPYGSSAITDLHIIGSNFYLGKAASHLAHWCWSKESSTDIHLIWI